MTIGNVTKFPDGTIPYREYEVELSDGSTASLAFTLCEFDADTVAARLAHEQNAAAYGMVSVLDMPGAPEHPIVWMVDATQFMLATERGDAPISQELETVIELYVRLFFIQLAP